MYLLRSNEVCGLQKIVFFTAYFKGLTVIGIISIRKMEIIIDICKQILYVTNLVVKERIPGGPPVLHKCFSIAKPMPSLRLRHIIFLPQWAKSTFLMEHSYTQFKLRLMGFQIQGYKIT